MEVYGASGSVSDYNYVGLGPNSGMGSWCIGSIVVYDDNTGGASSRKPGDCTRSGVLVSIPRGVSVGSGVDYWPVSGSRYIARNSTSNGT